LSKVEGMTRKIQEKLEAFALFLGSYWSTKDYDQLKYFDTNRPITHYLPILKSIDLFGYQIKPADIAFVNDEFIIMDGQGRHHAAKIKSLPYYFSFHPEVTTKEDVINFIAGSNSAQTKFGLTDYAHLHSQTSKHHKQFEELLIYSRVEGAKPPAIKGSELLAILMGVRPGGSFYTGKNSMVDAFKADSDNFSFTKEEYEHAKHVIDMLKQFALFIRCWTRREFISAFIRVIENRKFRIKAFVKALKGKRSQILFNGSPNRAVPRTREEFGNAILQAHNSAVEDQEHMITDISFEQEKIIATKKKRREVYIESKTTKENGDGEQKQS